MTDTDYKTLLNDILAQAARTIAEGQPLSPDQIVAGLIAGRPENARFKEQILKTTRIKAADFDKALHRKRTIDALGLDPQTALDLVETVVQRDGIGCRYNGTLFRSGPTKAKLRGDEIIITPEHMDDPQMRTVARMLGRKSIRFSEFARRVRMVRDKLGLKFTDTQITDAADEWYEAAKRERSLDLYIKVAGPLATVEEEHGFEETLIDLVERCFDLTGTSPKFVAAVLKKFVWQVKRKMLGLPVTDHLMPVLLGPQGSGKSTFIRLMTEALAEAMASVDFRMIADDRIIDIWSNFILFIDEMGYATKTDIDAVKNIITAESLSRRPMRTNTLDLVTQNATFIGASNKELNELIRDPTGARRFVGLRWRRDASWAAINAFLWLDLWRSVDAEAEDPVRSFAEELKAQQALARYRSPIEAWLDQFDRCHVRSELWDTNTVRARDLYIAYR
ncbi:hypothetical protein WYO_0835, partial [Methylobacterium sp. GXF4]|uniref:VapE domain-containing protein n=1 Tax=Methylobacterium sp. GXF4 TaxID=1096546 RepID=UPI0002698F78